MKIIFHRKFEKNFKKLSPGLKKKTIKIVNKFANNPFAKSLKNHSLKGKLVNQRSISVDNDLRIIFEEQYRYIQVLMINIGTHEQIY